MLQNGCIINSVKPEICDTKHLQGCTVKRLMLRRQRKKTETKSRPSCIHVCKLRIPFRSRSIAASRPTDQYSKGSPYSITERRVPELTPVLGSQHAGVMSHKPGGRLPVLSAGPAVTPATLKRAAANFAAW